MANYKMMYLALVKEVTNAIDALRDALEKTEDIYMDDPGDEAED